MLIAANGGDRLHAPGNSRVALLSAYTAGADALEFGVQLTTDAHPVVASVGDVGEATGEQGAIGEYSLEELRALDFGAKFSVANSAATPWKKDPPEARVQTLGGLLDVLPPDLLKIIRAQAESTAAGIAVAEKIIAALERRGALGQALLASDDAEVLAAAQDAAPGLNVALITNDVNAAQNVDAVILPLEVILQNEQLSPLAMQLQQKFGEGALSLGVIARGKASEAAYRVLSEQDWMFALSTDSVVEAAEYSRRLRTLEEASFAGTNEDGARFRFGYAKATPFAHVYQDDGVHIEIRPYKPPPPVNAAPSNDPLENQLRDLEEAAWTAARNWPFYSGGGFGTNFGLDGDFIAEVDFSSTTTSQATMLEMAVVNVDPPKHRPGWIEKNGARVPNLPKSFRDKNSFFDPHGAPPFVGVEHDEDDGYRINWNLGVEYDNNQYGRPLGDGTTKSGRLRLERRGPYFSAYYQDEQNSDWVCVGACRNDSMNHRVFLRCAGKRWRQENDAPDADEPYFPIPENHIVFKNFVVWTTIESATD